MGNKENRNTTNVGGNRAIKTFIGGNPTYKVNYMK
jgi:hypothetical protein